MDSIGDTDLSDVNCSTFLSLDDAKQNMHFHSAISLIHWNIRSLSTHFQDLQFLLMSFKHDFDFICLSEIWFKGYELNACQFPEYAFEISSRSNTIFGGVGIY